MGRIPKSKIEQIQALLQKGYLKKEVAKEVGVHARTVSKYDPHHKTKSVTSYSMKRQLEAVSEAVKTLLDWQCLLQDQHQLVGTFECPRCQAYALRFTEVGSDELFYLCVRCGYRLTWPWEICRQCFSQDVVYDRETRQYICPECGNTRTG